MMDDFLYFQACNQSKPLPSFYFGVDCVDTWQVKCDVWGDGAFEIVVSSAWIHVDGEQVVSQR